MVSMVSIGSWMKDKGFACKGTKNFQYTQACRLKQVVFIQQGVLSKQIEGVDQATDGM